MSRERTLPRQDGQFTALRRALAPLRESRHKLVDLPRVERDHGGLAIRNLDVNPVSTIPKRDLAPASLHDEESGRLEWHGLPCGKTAAQARPVS